MSVGDVLSVRLPEIGGTAFEWQIDKMNAVSLMSNSLLSPLEKTPGGTIVREMIFEAGAIGSGEILLSRYRRWETPQQADANFYLKLAIG